MAAFLAWLGAVWLRIVGGLIAIAVIFFFIWPGWVVNWTRPPVKPDPAVAALATQVAKPAATPVPPTVTPTPSSTATPTAPVPAKPASTPTLAAPATVTSTVPVTPTVAAVAAGLEAVGKATSVITPTVTACLGGPGCGGVVVNIYRDGVVVEKGPPAPVKPTALTAPPAPPTPTPTPVPPAPPAPVPDRCARSLTAGEEYTVPAGCRVSGDIQVWDGVRWVPLHDNLAQTGLIVLFSEDMKIRAPWGASVSSVSIDILRKQMEAAGCGLPNGCETVKVVTWPN